VDASPHTIDVIDDQPPAVHFTKPGRDTQATPVGAVPQVRATTTTA
jgi:hypothetical protein